MTNKSKNKNLASIITIYEAIWCRYRDDGRVSTNSEGYYFRYNDAIAAIHNCNKRRNFHSSDVRSEKAVMINKKVYEFAAIVPEDEINLVKPSELESITEDTAVLDMGNAKVIAISTSPIKVK